MAFTSGYLNSPATTGNPEQTDDELRRLKLELKTIVEREHIFDLASGGTQGHSRQGSAKAWYQDTEPTVRPDGGALTDDDAGRIWVDTTGGLRVPKVYTGTTDGFQPLDLGLTGMIGLFPKKTKTGWLLCDGSQIDKGVNPEYAGLIYYLTDDVDASTAFLPPLHVDNGRFPRAVDGAETRAPDPGAVALVDAYDVQEDAFEDHDHRLDHTHGASVAAGHDSGDGRTGTVDSWAAGVISLSDDGSHTHKYYKPGNPGSARSGSLSRYRTEEADTHGSSKHYHTIPRAYGLTGLASEQAEDAQHGVPERTASTAAETRPDNVALWYLIRYS